MSWVRSSSGEAVREDAIATARLTPMNASREAPRLLDQDQRTASGVRENARDSETTNQSGEAAVSEEARAART
jgi:hypothetical protein